MDKIFDEMVKVRQSQLDKENVDTQYLNLVELIKNNLTNIDLDFKYCKEASPTEGMNILHCATAFGMVEIVQIIIEYYKYRDELFKINILSNESAGSYSALHYYTIGAHISAMQTLIN